MSSLERAGTQGSPEVAGAMLTVLGCALEHAPAAPVLSKLGPSVKVLMAVGRSMQDAPPALRGGARQILLEYSTS